MSKWRACTNALDAYVCECVAGYTDDSCESDVLECSSRPCQNGALCLDLIDLYSCRCQNGFEGNECEVDMTSVCPGHALPVAVTEREALINLDAYAPMGGRRALRKRCCGVPVNPCAHGGCVLTPASLTSNVQVPPGWTGDNCETDVDECDAPRARLRWTVLMAQTLGPGRAPAAWYVAQLLTHFVVG